MFVPIINLLLLLSNFISYFIISINIGGYITEKQLKICDFYTFYTGYIVLFVFLNALLLLFICKIKVVKIINLMLGSSAIMSHIGLFIQITMP